MSDPMTAERATEIKATAEKIRAKMARAASEHGRFSMSIPARRTEDLDLLVCDFMAETVPDLLAEIDRLTADIKLRRDDESEMCEAMNALIDEHGGWVEDGDDTYAGNFRRIITTLTAERDAAKFAIEQEIAVLQKYGDGRTHWEGCERTHASCAALLRLRAALAATGPGGGWGTVNDGFGSEWVKCGPGCSLLVVRPGKADCNENCDKCPSKETAGGG